MKNWIAIIVVVAAVNFRASAGMEPASPCSQEWYQFVEQNLISGDGQGHGPDLGSDEWKGVVEFKLGIRDQADLPRRDSDDWCQLIDQLVRAR
jgi:hypothetical protein